MRVTARVTSCVAALAVGGALRVTGTPQHGLHGVGLFCRYGHGQLFFKGQHCGTGLVGGGGMSDILQDRGSVALVMAGSTQSKIDKLLTTFLTLTCTALLSFLTLLLKENHFSFFSVLG